MAKLYGCSIAAFAEKRTDSTKELPAKPIKETLG